MSSPRPLRRLNSLITFPARIEEVTTSHGRVKEAGKFPIYKMGDLCVNETFIVQLLSIETAVTFPAWIEEVTASRGLVKDTGKFSVKKNFMCEWNIY